MRRILKLDQGVRVLLIGRGISVDGCRDLAGRLAVPVSIVGADELAATNGRAGSPERESGSAFSVCTVRSSPSTTLGEKGFGNHDRVSFICAVSIALLAGGTKRRSRMRGNLAGVGQKGYSGSPMSVHGSFWETENATTFRRMPSASTASTSSSQSTSPKRSGGSPAGAALAVGKPLIWAGRV